MEGGGTNFSAAFSTAYGIMAKYIQKENIKLVFMTDGQSDYPYNEVEQIKELKNAHPNKFEYYGIQFRDNGDTMKLISQQLDGKNSVALNSSDLYKAFMQVINRKI